MSAPAISTWSHSRKDSNCVTARTASFSNTSNRFRADWFQRSPHGSILADLDIAERRQAQDGRIRRKYRERVIDFRVSTLPSRFGEKVCLRLLDSSATQLGLDKLITNPQTLDLVRELGAKPFGMILVTGPTGSGKSTTLYS